MGDRGGPTECDDDVFGRRRDEHHARARPWLRILYGLHDQVTGPHPMQPDEVVAAQVPVIVSRYRASLGLDAEDVAQETAAIALSRIRAGRRMDNLSGYMGAVAAGLRHHLWRRQSRQAPLEYDPPAPPEHERLLVIRQLVETALAGITPRRRAALEAFYLGEEPAPNDSLNCCLRFNALRAARRVLERSRKK